MLARMDLSRFDTSEPDELRSYISFLLWHYRVMDSFWFLYLADEYSQAEAEKLNERVWARVSGLAARDLVSRFKVTEKGLQTDDEVVIAVPCCATQEARRKRGLGEYECREMHRKEFESIAAQVDLTIKVHCEFAPPGERPAGLDCRWRFTVEKGDAS
jgi:hypothetical protein